MQARKRLYSQAVAPDNEALRSAKKNKFNEISLILSLPVETLIYIFSFFSIKELIKVGLVNTSFYAIAQDNYLWKPLFLKYYPLSVDDQAVNYYLALKERLTVQFRKLTANSFLLTEKGEELYLALVTNEIHTIKTRFPDYSSIETCFYDKFQDTDSLPSIVKIFAKVSCRLLVNPGYQLGLNHLYHLLSQSVNERIEKREATNPPFSKLLFYHALRAILFSQPITELTRLKDNGTDFNIGYCHPLQPNAALYNPVYLATVLGNVDHVRWLYEIGVNLNQQFNHPHVLQGPNQDTCSLLYIAAHYGHHQLLPYLKTVLNDVELEKECLLAYEAQDVAAFSCFLEHGVEIDTEKILAKGIDFLRQFIAHLFTFSFDFPQSIMLLVFKRLFVALPAEEINNYPSTGFRTGMGLSSEKSWKKYYWLHCAIDINHLSLIRFLLNEGIHINQPCPNIDLQTPLMLASQYGYLPIVKLLIEKGAQITLDCGWKTAPRSNNKIYKKTPLHLAIACGQREVADYLYNIHVANHIPINKSALQHLFFNAAQKGWEDMILWLIEKTGMIDINKKDTQGKTALMMAQEKKHTTVMKLLRERGAKEYPHQMTMFPAITPPPLPAFLYPDPSLYPTLPYSNTGPGYDRGHHK